MSTKTKQVGFLSAIVISVGSTIGAGIFFKNGSIFSNADGDLWFLIASWVIAAIGVLAIAMALIEIASGTKGNGGIAEYTHEFTSRRFAKFSSSYMILVYLPLNYLAMPIYAAMSLQDSIQSVDADATMSGWAVMGIALAILAWFGITGFFQKKIAINSQWIFTLIKFIPLIVVAFFGLNAAFEDGASTQLIPNSDTYSDGYNKPTGLASVSPWLGIMASIPAILFAYDGFYAVTSMRNDLKEPGKMGIITALALSVITAGYLFFAVSTGVAGAGSIFGVGLSDEMLSIFNLMIMFAVFGIINGFALATPEIYYATYKEHPIGLVESFMKWFKIKDAKTASFVVSLVLAVIMYAVLGPIGMYVADSDSYAYYGDTASGLYQLADYVTNYTSLLVFIFFGGVIVGGLVNRRTNRVEVEKQRTFVPAAIISIVFLSIGAIYMIVANIVDMTGYKDADETTNIINFAIMSGTMLLAVAPLLWEFTPWYKNKPGGQSEEPAGDEATEPKVEKMNETKSWKYEEDIPFKADKVEN